jgi:hypothetical protein
VRVRLRPNAIYLTFALAAITPIAYGVGRDDVMGDVVTVVGALLFALLCYPIITSTVFRVPVLVVDDNGIRLPLMGVRLGWSELATSKRSTDLRGRLPAPVLLIVPTDPEAAVAQTHPWLRREARANLARHGTPIVLSGKSLDHSLDAIARAVQHHRKKSHPGA